MMGRGGLEGKRGPVEGRVFAWGEKREDTRDTRMVTGALG